jgi:hypothetical protein
MKFNPDKKKLLGCSHKKLMVRAYGHHMALMANIIILALHVPTNKK